MIGVEKFLAEILLARRLDARIDLLQRCIAAHFAAGIEQCLDRRLVDFLRRRLVDQQRLGRAADAGAAQLGIHHDRLRHFRLGLLVDIDVADALEMSEDRNPRLFLHARHQALAAARHDHIDIAGETGQHFADRAAVAYRHQLDRIFRQLRDAKSFRHGGVNGARRAMRIRSAAQDRGIAGLQAKRAGIGGDIGTALIDHANDADRRAHALDRHAVRPLPFLEHFADRIVQPCNHPETLGHRLDARAD